MLKRVLMPLLLLGLIPEAWSACTTSLTTASPSFGTSVSSFTLNATEQPTSTTLVLDCDSTLTLLTTDTATLTLTGASTLVGSRGAMKRSDNTAITDTIPVKVCGVAGCASGEATNGGTGHTWTGTPLLTLPGVRRYNLPLYLRTVIGQSVSAGPYTGTLFLNLYYSICIVGTVLTGCTTRETGNLTVNLPVSITITNDCTAIAAPAVAFGSAPVAKSFPSISQSITVTCTKDYAYTLGIDNGVNASGTTRRMAGTGSNRLSYEIYKGSTTSRWGSTGAERWGSSVSTQLSSDGTLRTFTYTAQVLPNQTTPPGGTYGDTLTIDIGL